MCGRYALIDGQKVMLAFQMMKLLRQQGEMFEMLPRYNASPMQVMPVVAIRDGQLIIQPMRWWLIPHWSKTDKPTFSTFNARSEGLESSKLFSPYFKGSRCLVPADAFYEWKKIASEKIVRGQTKKVEEKLPMCIRMKDEDPFMFAGLFSIWKKPNSEEEIPTFTILTTTPNEVMEPIHNRMPVILDEKDFEQWLDRDFKDTTVLMKLLKPSPAKEMKAYPVSKLVSNSRNDVPDCMKPSIDKHTT